MQELHVLSALSTVEERLVGREAEAQTAGRFVERFALVPTGLLICGEPGIGKTALWSHVVGVATERGARVLAARPAPAEARLAFAGLTDLLEPVADDVLPVLSAPQRGALEIALLRVEPRGHGLNHRAVAAAMVTLLRHLAARTPVLLAVDDIQWMDTSSATVIEFAVRRLGSLPVGVLACRRTARGRSRTVELERALPATVRLDLGPLGPVALHDIVTTALGRPVPRRIVDGIERIAGGNPFFALELARTWRDRAVADHTLRLTPSLRDVVTARVAGLPRSVQSVLLAVAALQAPSVAAVAAATGLSPAAALSALERAQAAELVELRPPQVRFTHPLYAVGVYEAASPATRRVVHQRLAGHVSESEERARHLALAATGADANLAATLDIAAETARARGATDAAAELVEAARRLTPPDRHDDAQRRAVRAAEYHFHAGDLSSARLLLDDVLRQHSQDPVRADALRLRGEIHYHQWGMADAIEMFSQALDHAGTDLRLRASVEMQLAFAMNSTGDWTSAALHASRALEAAEKLGDAPLLAEALAVSVIADYLHGRGLDRTRLERALALEDLQRQTSVEMRPTLIAGHLMLYEGQLERSCELLMAVRRGLLDRGEDGDMPHLGANLAWNACLRGDLAAAAGYVDEAWDCAERVDLNVGRCWARAFGALVAAFAGDAATTRARAEQALALSEQTGFVAATIWTRWALALLGLSYCDHAAADAALAPLTAMLEQDGIEEPARCMFLSDHIEALIGMGELDRAERLADLLEQAGRRLDRGWVRHQAGRCRALLHAARGSLDAATVAAEEALALGQTLQHRLEYARTCLAVAQIDRRCRRRGQARSRAGRALAIFDQCGARQWAQRAREELDRSAARPARTGLTETERRVAELAAAGRTNRQVAALLFISPKTVEANLARVYTKLGIRSRAELGSRLGRTQPVPEVSGALEDGSR